MAPWTLGARARGSARAVVGIGITTLLTGAVPAAAATAGPPPWYVGSYNMAAVWQKATGSGVVVAVVGDGVGSPQEMLANALIPGVDLSSDGGAGGTADVLPSYDGTQMAALIAAASGSPIQGLAPGASIMPVRTIAKGETTSAPAATAKGIDYAAAHGATVLLVADTAPKMDDAVAAAVLRAANKGVIIVAPSGNTGLTGNVVNSMCTFDGVLCVGGTTAQGSRWKTSASGPEVDLVAAGDDITVPSPASTKEASSTHYSAALVAAEAALVRSAHPKWTAGQVVRVMLGHTTGGNASHTRVNDDIGYGVIDPLGAVTAAAPTLTSNPLLPAVTTSPVPVRPTAPAAAKHSGNGSAVLLIAGGGALVLIVGAILGVLGWSRRRRASGGNYLTNPAYGAGHYYDQPQVAGDPFRPLQLPPARYDADQGWVGPATPAADSGAGSAYWPPAPQGEYGQGYTQPYIGEPPPAPVRPPEPSGPPAVTAEAAPPVPADEKES